MAGGVIDVGIVKGGKLSKSVAGSADVTLVQAEWENRYQEYTGILTGNIDVILPLQACLEWIVSNQTTGAFTLTVKGATGTGYVVPQGDRKLVVCDGTDFFTLD
jgi:hypothetical protein